MDTTSMIELTTGIALLAGIIAVGLVTVRAEMKR